MKALFLEPFFTRPEIKSLEVFTLDQKQKFDPKEIDIIFTKLSRKIDDGFLSIFENVKYVVTPTTGIDHIDTKYCSARGIAVIKLLPQDILQIFSTTEIALWHIINLTRSVLPYVESTRNSHWDRYAAKTFSLRSHKVGIVGFGRLGRQIYGVLKCLGAQVKVFDSDSKKVLKLSNDERADSIEEIFSLCSVVSLHLSSTHENEGIVNKKAFSKITSSPFFLINTARGNVIDETDLLEFLDKGIITGYGADSILGEYDSNSLFSNNLFRATSTFDPRVFLTPHIGGATQDSMEITEDIVFSRLAKELASVHDRVIGKSE